MEDSVGVCNNNSRAIVAANSDSNITPRTPLSCFINVTIARNSKAIHDPSTKKVRIKVPKLFHRAVRRKGPAANNQSSSKETKKLGKKFASLWSDLFGSKKSSDTSSFNGKRDTSHGSNSKISVGEEIQTPNTSVGIRDRPNSASMGIRNGSNIGEDDASLAPVTPLSKINHSLKDVMKVEDKNMKQQQSLQQSIVAHQLLTLNIPGSFLKFLNMGKRITGGSDKSKNGDTGNAGGVDDRRIVRQSCKAFQVSTRLQIGFLVKPWLLEKVRSRDDEGGDRELCRKRILMGERCRPLNS